MFICSVKAGTLRFFGAILLALALFVTILTLVEPQGLAAGTEEYAETVTFSGIRSDEERVAFLSSFGWQVASATPSGEVSFTMPKEFDRVLAGYNEIQKSQGLDLVRYAGKKVTRYTYEITNYDGYEGKVYANLIMYKNKIVAADITSADPYGFVHGLEK